MTNEIITAQQYAERLRAERTIKSEEETRRAKPFIDEIDSKILSLKEDKTKLEQDINRKEWKVANCRELKKKFETLNERKGIHIYSVYGPWSTCIDGKTYEGISSSEEKGWRSARTTRQDLLAYYETIWDKSPDVNSQPIPEQDIAYQTLCYLRGFSSLTQFDDHLLQKEILSDLEKLVRALHTRTMKKDEYLEILKKTHPTAIKTIKYGEKSRGCFFGDYLAQEEYEENKRSPFASIERDKLSHKKTDLAIKEIESTHNTDKRMILDKIK